MDCKPPKKMTIIEDIPNPTGKKKPPTPTPPLPQQPLPPQQPPPKPNADTNKDTPPETLETRKFTAPPHTNQQPYNETYNPNETHEIKKFINNAHHSTSFLEYYIKICRILNIPPENYRSSITKFIITHTIDMTNHANAIETCVEEKDNKYIDTEGLKQILENLLSKKTNYTNIASSIMLWKFLYHFLMFLPHEKYSTRPTPPIAKNKMLTDTTLTLVKCKIPNITYDLCARLILTTRISRLQSMKAVSLLMRNHASQTKQPEQIAEVWATTYATGIIDTRYTQDELFNCLTDIIRNHIFIDIDGFQTKYTNFRTGIKEFSFTHATVQDQNNNNHNDTNKVIHKPGLRLRLQAVSYNTLQKKDKLEQNTKGGTTNMHDWKISNKISVLLSMQNTRLAMFIQTQQHLLDIQQREAILKTTISSAATRSAILKSTIPEQDEQDYPLFLDHINQLNWNKQPFPELKLFMQSIAKYIPASKTTQMTKTDWLHMYIYAYQRGDPTNVSSVHAFCINATLGFYSSALATHMQQFTGTNTFNSEVYNTILEQFATSLSA
jgi:hypothetical protein